MPYRLPNTSDHCKSWRMSFKEVLWCGDWNFGNSAILVIAPKDCSKNMASFFKLHCQPIWRLWHFKCWETGDCSIFGVVELASVPPIRECKCTVFWKCRKLYLKMSKDLKYIRQKLCCLSLYLCVVNGAPEYQKYFLYFVFTYFWFVTSDIFKF